MTKSVSLSAPRSKDVSHERILDAAEGLLERYGYKRMTMDDLAQAVGLSKGALYLRFKSKEDVAISTLERVNTRLRVHLSRMLAHPSDPMRRLKEMLLERVMFRFDSVKGYSESFDDVFAAIRPHMLKCREEWLAEETKLFACAIEMGQEAGFVRTGDAYGFAAELLLATKGLLPYRLFPFEIGKRKELEERARKLIAFLLLALENPAGRGPDELSGECR